MASLFKSALQSASALGVFAQFGTEVFPTKWNWTPENDMPDLSGKIALVTGGNTGIGKASIEQLLLKNCKVYLAARSEEKAKAAIQDLKASTGKQDVHWLKLDLGDPASVREAAEEYKNKESELHLLFLSAGVMNPPSGSKTITGHELQLGTNVLGHFYLVKLLLDTVLATAEKYHSPTENSVRIISTSSNGHAFAPRGGLKWKDPNSLTGMQAYGQSKYLNVVIANELARRYGDRHLQAASLNPGGIKTELTRHTPLLSKLMGWLFFTTKEGCINQLYAGTASETGSPANNGKYYIPFAREGLMRSDLLDVENNKKLWEWMEAEVAKFDA